MITTIMYDFFYLSSYKGHGLKFCVGSRVWQETVEGQRRYQPKHEYNNKDEDNNLKTRMIKIIELHLINSDD